MFAPHPAPHHAAAPHAAPPHPKGAFRFQETGGLRELQEAFRRPQEAFRRLSGGPRSFQEAPGSPRKPQEPSGSLKGYGLPMLLTFLVTESNSIQNE